MALVTMAYPEEDERPWKHDLGPNNPKRLNHWHTFQIESIQQRKALGIELNAEEEAILAELESGHNRPVEEVRNAVPEVEPEPAPPTPPKRRRKLRKPAKPVEARVEPEAWDERTDYRRKMIEVQEDLRERKDDT